MSDAACIRLLMKADCSRSWYYPLQKGIFLNGISDMSVRSFLHEVLEFDDGYIEGTVRTIFLNNSPVDNIDETFLEDGDRLALGSAMPGLVGIVMGRDNPFKTFRSDISAQDGVKGGQRTPITVSVKLFSSLAVESGVAILKRGVSIDTNMLADFLENKIDCIIEADGMDGGAFLASLRESEGLLSVSVNFK